MTKPHPASDPVLKHLATVKGIVAASFTGQHDRVAKFSIQLALELKAAAELCIDPTQQAKVMEFAQWIDGQLAYQGHSRSLHPAASRVAIREADTTRRMDPVQNLLARRVIGTYELEACKRIARMFELLSSGMGLQARDYRDCRVDTSGTFQHPVDRMSYEDSFEITLVYRPWARVAQNFDVGVMVKKGQSIRHAGLTCYELVRKVLVDRRTLRALETTYKMRHGALVRPLIQTLRAYSFKLTCANANDVLGERAMVARAEETT